MNLLDVTMIERKFVMYLVMDAFYWFFIVTANKDTTMPLMHCTAKAVENILNGLLMIIRLWLFQNRSQTSF